MKSRNQFWFVALLFTLHLVCAVVFRAEAAALYSVTDLGTNVSPLAINNAGDVVGVWQVPGSQRTFLYTNGVATNFNAATAAGGTNSGANGINNLGQVAGWFQDSQGRIHAFAITNGAVADLAVPLTQYASARFTWNGAVGINDAGQILGTYETNGSAPTRVYLVTNGVRTDLPTLNGVTNGYNLAAGINQAGVVALTAQTNLLSQQFQRACLYSNNTLVALLTPANMQAWAFGINDSNQVVGYLQPTNLGTQVQNAFVYDQGVVTILGGLGTNYANTSAAGINNYQQTVGQTTTTNGSVPFGRGFVHDPDNGITDLNSNLSTAGWLILDAAGINDAGQIVGRGFIGTGPPVHGVLLTPSLIYDPKSIKYHAGTFTFTISGLNGKTVIIEATCDWSIGSPISTNTIVRNTTTFTDPDTSTCAQRSYRARVD